MLKGKILVVDDEPEIVKSVKIRLEASGYEVITAMDGLQATQIAIKQQPDLIILDIGMPAGDGHVVLKRIKDNVSTETIPIIFLTARTSMDDYEKAGDAGIDKYLTKPFKSEELLAAVEELLFSKVQIEQEER